MRDATEQEIQKSFLDYLRLKGCIAFKHHSTASTVRGGKAVFFKYGDRGISDIIGCTKTGRFLAIEVKRKGGKASVDQVDFIRRVIAQGGIGIITDDLNDVMAEFESIKK